MWVPNLPGTHRLARVGATGASERACVCDTPGHCSGHQWCACSTPADPDEIADVLRALPGVESVRVRKHATLPATHPARYSNVTEDPPTIEIGLDEPGKPPTKVIAKYPRRAAHPLSDEQTVDALANLSETYRICPAQDLLQFPGDGDPRPDRRLHVFDVVAAYVKVALDSPGVPPELATTRASLRKPGS
jgi:hypothetical protein